MLKICNKNTFKFYDAVNERTIYLFNYNKNEINLKKLQNIKKKKCWDVLKHPYVLNYINETLLHSFWIYVIQIILYIIYLVVLYLHIYDVFRELTKWIITIFTPILLILWVSN